MIREGKKLPDDVLARASDVHSLVSGDPDILALFLFGSPVSPMNLTLANWYFMAVICLLNYFHTTGLMSQLFSCRAAITLRVVKPEIFKNRYAMNVSMKADNQAACTEKKVF